MQGLFFIFIVFISVIAFFMFMYFVPVGLWITAIFAGVKITIGELIGMRIRKVPPGIIVNSLITATKAGLNVTTRELETHFLAGGDVPNVIRALISAEKANINLSFKQATRSEEHTSELQSPCNLVCRLLLEKKEYSR